jgi:hypothetical protein
MAKTIATTVAFVTLAALATRAQADGCAGCAAPAPTCVAYEEKTVTCYRPEFHEREEKCVEDKVVLHRDVTTEKYTVQIPIFEEQKRLCTVLTHVPHDTFHQETRCRLVSQCITDPCTGCTVTVCRPETYVETGKCTTWGYIPTQKEVTEQVCTGCKTEERTRECVHVICEHHPEPGVRKVNYCIMVPYEVKVKVPVCPAEPACGGSCSR